jgi:hypothetical protein
MIIDPLSFVPAEIDRHLAMARALPRKAPRRRPPRRGIVLRLATWATGRSVHA